MQDTSLYKYLIYLTILQSERILRACQTGRKKAWQHFENEKFSSETITCITFQLFANLFKVTRRHDANASSLEQSRKKKIPSPIRSFRAIRPKNFP